MGKFLYVRDNVGTAATTGFITGESSLPAFSLTSVATGTAANDLSVDIVLGGALDIAYANNTITITVVSGVTDAGDIDAAWSTSVAAPIATFFVQGASVAFNAASSTNFTGGLDEKRLGFNVDHLKQIQAQDDSEIKLIIAEDHQSGVANPADTTEVVLNISANEHAQVIAKIAEFVNAPRLNFATLADDVQGGFLTPQILGVKSITY
jgi:hypothetical protein